MKEGTNIRSFNFDKDPTEVMVLEEKKYKKKNDTIDIKCVVCFNQQMHASACIHMVKNNGKHYCFLVFDHANTFASMRWLVKIHNKNVIFSRKAELLDNRKKERRAQRKKFQPFSLMCKQAEKVLLPTKLGLRISFLCPCPKPNQNKNGGKSSKTTIQFSDAGIPDSSEYQTDDLFGFYIDHLVM